MRSRIADFKEKIPKGTQVGCQIYPPPQTMGAKASADNCEETMKIQLIALICSMGFNCIALIVIVYFMDEIKRLRAK